MKKIITNCVIFIIIISNLFIFSSCSKKQIRVNISHENIGVDINKNMYGLFLEDISYAGDGGLISNLVANDSFEYTQSKTANWEFDNLDYVIENLDGLNDNNKSYLMINSKSFGTFTNLGYVEYYNDNSKTYNKERMNTPDMGFKKDTYYAFSCYVKNIDFNGHVYVYLNSNSNKENKYEIDIQYNNWTKIEKELFSKEQEDGGLSFDVEGSGTICFDFITLESKNSHGYGDSTWKYVSLREDLYQALKDLNPSFIRFPGGCLAEGEYLSSLYNWKETIGPLENRVQYHNIWSDDVNGKAYGNTNALGYHEYFQLSEDLGAEALPILNVGMICQFEVKYRKVAQKYKQGKISDKEWQEYLDTFALRPGTIEFENYVQDILDLIEYANGDISTKWGAIRAQNGHPESFNLKYIGLGNENWGEVYWRNFDAIYPIIKANHPEITIISSVGWRFKGPEKTESWEYINSKYKDTIVDEHYYTEKNLMFKNNNYYDNYDRDGAKVFVGEYAATVRGMGSLQTKNNLWSAVEEASYMLGMERNGDIVQWASYAPTFAKINSLCWDINMIWFDSQEVVLTPNYYNQLLFSNNIGSKVVNTNFKINGCYSTTTVDEEEQVIYFKIVNTNKQSIELNLDIFGFGNLNASSMQYLSDKSQAACNMLHNTTIIPKQIDCKIDGNSINTIIEGYSINIIRIYYKDNIGDNAYLLPQMLSTMDKEIKEYKGFYVPWKTQVGLYITLGIVGGCCIIVTIVLLSRFLYNFLKNKKIKSKL